MPPETADYAKHTDTELRDGIARVDQQLARIAAEDSDAAVQAARTQREAMTVELERRQASR